MPNTEQWVATYIATIKHYYELIAELERDKPLFRDLSEYHHLHRLYTTKYNNLIDEFEEVYSAYRYS